ncbi:hypothetical protein [Egbenema bharatensis]|uniref:hypothetical protein n=1 Tax=Egbenema bharatensis TaxID=3463334 RepID=UPI003A86F83B
MLLFVHRLHRPKRKPASPQKPDQFQQQPLIDAAHKNAVEQLHRVQSNYFLERGLFR